jgi:pilus assembly protein CpaB
MGRRTLLLIASIIVAAVGTGVVALYANTAENRAFDASSPVDALYSTADIPAGINGQDALKRAAPRTISGNAAPTGYLTKDSNLAGLTANRLIRANEPLSRSMFSAPGQASEANPLALESDRLAVSINVTDVARVAGYAGPGSYVALYVTTGDPDQAGSSAVHLLLADPAKVIKVSTAGTEVATPAQTLVTLDLDKVQAGRVILASQTAQVYMALVKDSKVKLGGDVPIQESDIAPAGTPSPGGSGN